MMDCKTIQKMIIPFDSNRLSMKEEEKFISHIENCDDCKEEFEIHYIVTYGLSDDDEYLNVQPEYRRYLESYDFKGLVEQKIRNSKKKTENLRKMNELQKLCLVGANFCIAMVILIFMIIRYY